MEHWLQTQLPRLSAKTPLAAAIRYALTRLQRLRPYLEHGFLELDNNAAERAMRPLYFAVEKIIRLLARLRSTPTEGLGF